MPAYREQIYLCPAENGQPGWVMDFPIWWDRREFFHKYGERQMDTGNPTYADYALLLTAWEAAAWNQQAQETFARDPRSQQSQVVEAMQQFEMRLKATSWVIVESYEWESGLE
jgi:hypothetical protein